MRNENTVPCIICSKTPSDKCHIFSKGSGASDESWNIVRMCRVHHIEQHRHGWRFMCEKYPIIFHELEWKGFHFEFFFGVWKLRRNK